MKIASIGELIIDHIFIKDDFGDDVYHVSRGGGTPYNVLYNLKHYYGKKIKAYAIGVYGKKTKFSGDVVDELKSKGINTDYLLGVENKYSKQIFQVTINGQHKFSDRCVICNERVKYTKLPTTNQLKTISGIDWGQFDIVFTDKMLADRVNVVKETKKVFSNVKFALDMGRLSYLRYFSIPKIISSLHCFDLINFNERIYESLNNRISKYYNRQLIDLLLENNEDLIITITKAEKGLMIYRGSKEYETINAPKINKFTDSSGAGDSLISSLLYSWWKSDFNYKSNTFINTFKKEINKIKISLESIGARGFDQEYSLSNPYYKGIFNEKKTDIIGIESDGTHCSFCKIEVADFESSKKAIAKKRKGSINQTFNDLPKRLLSAFDAIQVIHSTKTILSSFEGVGYVLGSGGSYSSSEFISLVINGNGNSTAIPVKPYNFIRLKNNSLIDFIIIISYSGSTKDYIKVIDKAVDLKIKKIVLVSHSSKGKLWKYIKEKYRIFDENAAEILIDYSKGRSQKERGFLSVSGTLLPSLFFFLAHETPLLSADEFWNTLVDIKDKKYESLNKFAEKVKSNKIIEMFGTGYSWPALIDLESKLIEGNVCCSIVHEMKDFSHGRFMYSLNNDNPAIVILTQIEQYDKRLIEIISDSRETIVIESKNRGIKGAFELLLEVQYFIFKLSKAIDPKYDITKPKKVNSKGLELYRWNFE